VQVCPTGIDIRNGLQYECIGCAACIDACDQVMDQLHAPRGLIRYTSEAALEGESNGKPAWQRPRVLFYSSLLLGIIGLSVVSFTQRLPFKADILRDRASLVRETDDGWLENSYSVRLINSSETAQRLAISVEGLPGIRLVAATPTVHWPPPPPKPSACGCRLNHKTLPAVPMTSASSSARWISPAMCCRKRAALSASERPIREPRP
jgi:polyferredoxin